MRKLFLFISAVLLVVSFGCQKKKEPTPPIPKSGEPAGAGSVAKPVEDYASGLKGNLDKAKGVQAKSDMGELETAIRNYQMENGRYPDSLDAIKPYVRSGVDTAKFNYNPLDGSVSLK